tara:strand:+ start:85 stop:270 length:186 start_codon:yes stop_codon:yes gene_type:complete
MSYSGKISQLILLFIAIFACDYFVFEMPDWLFIVVATLSVATLDVFQSEHDIKLFQRQHED